MSYIPAPLPLYKLIEDASSASLREISHLLPLWFWETDADCVITYASENIEPLTGVTGEQLMGVCILNPAHGRGESEAGLKDYHDALRRRERIKSFSYERTLLSGERVVLLDSAVPQFDSDGTFTGYCGVSFHLSNALDVAGLNGSLMGSLRDRAEELELALSQRKEELETSNRLLIEVLDALGEGLLVTSKKEGVLQTNVLEFANPAFQKLIGLENADVYQGMAVSVLHELLRQRTISEVPVEKHAERLRRGETLYVQVRESGTELEVKGIKRPGGGTVVVFTDVTQLNARTRLLETARQDAERANQTKSNFLASMSHEIRTPMNGIIGVSELLSETQLDDDQTELVDTIRRSALALTGLIGDILDFSKIEAGHLTLAHEPVNLRELIKDMSNMMTPMAQAKGIQFVTDIRDASPLVVMGDKLRLRQILVNLLGNAIKFTAKGYVTLSIWVEADGCIRVDVADTGVGIPSEQLENVFNSFEQVQGGFQRPFEGTGLGLAITRELVDAMEGQIWVDSSLGEGSTFSLSVPLVASEVAANTSDAAEARILDLSQHRILLAEDNITNQFVVKKMLERLGVTPEIVSNGEEACKAMAEGQFDLVLMDISMPVMSGLEATRHIRKMEQDDARPRCPIVALTGNAFDTDRNNSLEAGMDMFLTKPILKDQLRHCLDEILGEVV